MKSYRFNDLGQTWWAEFRTDGMEDSVQEKVVSIRSLAVGATEINGYGLSDAMVALGLPVHTGADVTEVGLIAFAAANNLTLTKKYEFDAATTKNTALTLQATPTFNPAAGAIPFGTSITISSASADKIYYTKNGAVPTVASTDQSVTPLVWDGTEPIIKAIATKSGKFTSAVGSAVYTQAAAAAPTSVTLAVGSTAPVGGVTNVAIPADAATDNTGKVTGWVATSAAKIKITVVDAANTASTMTINGGAYVSGADYTIAAVGTLTVVLTTTRANYKTCVRTFTIDVTA